MEPIFSCLGSSWWMRVSSPSQVPDNIGPQLWGGWIWRCLLSFFSFSFFLQIASLVTVTFMGKQWGSRGEGGSYIMFLWKQGLRPRLEPLRGRCPISGGREDAKIQVLFATGQDPVPPETIWSPSHEPREEQEAEGHRRESSLCSSPHTIGTGEMQSQASYGRYWQDQQKAHHTREWLPCIQSPCSGQQHNRF